ncbi:MAG: hypothetical protein GYA59_14400 [Chloroflexi bacterium]|jgi:hypothetical protein|nr:hypothetical protein [Chloroflexota bacterium]
MTQLILNKEEQEILIQLLETSLSDLRMEIAGTDNITYKQMLKQRKDVLKRLLVALRSPEALSTAA